MKKTVDHSFSVEMKSKECVKQISLSSNDCNSVLLEGFLGELEKISMIEDLVLEIKGVDGTLRIDMTKDELESFLKLNCDKTKEHETKKWLTTGSY